MKRGRKPGKRHIAQDLAMREEGYATAWEVADALNVALSTVHHRLKLQQIPGIEVPTVGGKYSRWYVNICALVTEYPKSAPESLRKALTKLCAQIQAVTKKKAS